MKLKWWVEKKWPVLVLLLTWRRTSENKNEPNTRSAHFKAETETELFEDLLLGHGSSKESPAIAAAGGLSQLRAQLASHSKAVGLAAKPDRRMTAALEQPCSCKLPWQPRAAGGQGRRHTAQPPGAAVISWCNEEWGKERSCGWCSAVLSAISCSEAPQNNALLSPQ